MLDIRFHPECDLPELVTAAAEYQRLWDAHRQRIVAAFSALTGLQHAEGLINAIVFEGASGSHPLCLRASYDEDTRLGALIHELGHRLIRGNRARLCLPPPQRGRQRENHDLLNLFLYDVWTDLFGEAFARRQVEVESSYQPFYREAWEAVLALSRAERSARLAALVRHPAETP